MICVIKTFEELATGDVLTSSGGSRWKVFERFLDMVGVEKDGVKTWFKQRRDYWRFMVVTA